MYCTALYGLAGLNWVAECLPKSNFSVWEQSSETEETQLGGGGGGGSEQSH